MTLRSNDKVEILILGSGIAGSTMAAELAEAGHEVLTLEAGPARGVENMISSQMSVVSRIFRTFGFGLVAAPIRLSSFAA